MNILETPEWELGDAAQKQWARIVVASGGIVVPAYGLQEITPETKAPMLMGASKLFVSPDLLLLRPDGKSKWHEVKAKSSPTWRKFPPGPRWEHGIDAQLVDEYSEVERASGLPVLIVVQEKSEPIDPMIDCERRPCSSWLCIGLRHARRIGDIRADWPGGKCQPFRRGRGGKGGLLWARSEMRRVALAPLSEMKA